MQRFSHTLDSLRNARAARLTAFRLLPSARQRTVSEDFLLVDVTPHGQPIYRMPLNLYAALTTGVTPLRLGELGISLQGKGMIVGVWDAGKVADHIELGDRVIFKEEAALHPHATHVTGTLISTGINMYTKGMAPLAQAKTWYYDNDYDDIYNQMGPDGVKLSNHSYGSATGWVKVSSSQWVWAGDPAISDKEDYRFGFYDLDAQYIDELSNLDPYHLFVWAAGNDRAEVGTGEYPQDGNQGTGYDCLIPEANAKNHIVVGAVARVTNYTGPASVPMAYFSSWGPTDDGRIKPDVVADGVNVYSLTSSPANGYLQSSGTSQATANVTGSLILVQELYNRLHGNTPMRAATLRALAIHTVKEAGTNPGPDYQYGWGLLDVKQAAQTLLDNDDVNVMVRELTLDNQQTISIPLQPQAGQKITVTIGWTDPAGTPVAHALDPTDLMLVNDLDVKLVDADGNETLPWILDPANPATAAIHGNNFRDNVEKIELDAPLDKNYTIVITHKGTLAQAQPFSLIVTHQSKTPTGTAYYWIGNSGSWSDPAHWSLSTGGTSAGTVPTATDRVTLDDNSFTSNTEETITLDGDATCRSMLWLTSKPAAFDMSAHVLTTTNMLTLASDTFRIANQGTFKFDGDGQVQLHTNLDGATLQFHSGTWALGGTVNTDVNIIGGSVDASTATILAPSIQVYDNATLDIRGNSFVVAGSFNATATATVLSEGTTIAVNDAGSFTWVDLDFDGTINVGEAGFLLMDGTGSSIDSLQVAGKLVLLGSNTIHHLQASGGANLQLGVEQTQTIDTLSLDATADARIVLRSADADAGNTSIAIPRHEKLCLDYLDITSVDVTDQAVVVAGINSTLTNSHGWVEGVTCDAALLPDFDVAFTCEQGLTMFTDRSSGPASDWLWDFGDKTSGNNTGTGTDVSHHYAHAGTYTVTLTVKTSSGLSQTYTRLLTITSNTVPVNTLIFDNGMLKSSQTADHYQWYMNGELLENATGNTIEPKTEGRFAVLTTVGDCNYMSDEFFVTATEPGAEQAYRFSPNPADRALMITTALRRCTASIYTAMGQYAGNASSETGTLQIDTSQLQDGLYIADVNGHKIKFVVLHR